jgi:hypothetical protein
VLLNGKCHCGNIAFTLDWPDNQPDVPARECSCSFCVKHGGVWTSNPRAKLSVVLHQADLISKYAFGTETATFHICARCGTVPIVTSEIAGHLYAVVNVNTFEGLDPLRLRRAASNLDGEDVQSRLARRRRNWIADVSISDGSAKPIPTSTPCVCP